MRVKRDFRQEGRDLWKKMKVDEPALKKIKYDQFRSIVREFNDCLVNYVLETGDHIQLPHRLGSIGVVKDKQQYQQTTIVDGQEKKVNKMCIDWKTSREVGKKVYFLNEHTGGLFFKLKWFRYKSGVIYKDMWYFESFRQVDRLLAHYIKNRGLGKLYRFTDKI